MNNKENYEKELLDEKLITPSLLDNNFLLKSPMKSWIGDFTDNPYIFNGEEILEVNQNQNNDSSSIYMKSILDLYQALNYKIDKMAIVRTDNDFILENICNYLILGDTLYLLHLRLI